MRFTKWLFMPGLAAAGVLVALLILGLNPLDQASPAEADGALTFGPNEPTAVGTPNDFIAANRAFQRQGDCGTTTNCAVVDEGIAGEYKSFAFDVPAGVLGIEVTIGGDPRSGDDEVEIRLLDADEEAVGDARTVSLTGGGGYSEHAVGGTDDLWGAAWTEATIDDPDFGVEITNGSTGGGFDLDYVHVTVYAGDQDGDGVPDPDDNCPTVSNPGQEDYDGDDLGDACDDDVDGDGVANADDECPLTPLGESVDSGGCSQSQIDEDEDGICNPGAPPRPECSGSDNCPSTPNADQTNTDQALADLGAQRNGAPIGDGDGDACDDDDDDDGFTDAVEQAIRTNWLDNCFGAPTFTPAGLSPLEANDAWPADFNVSGTVEVDEDRSISHDLNVVVAMFGRTAADVPLARRADLTGDGAVSSVDISTVILFADQTCQ